LLSDTKDVCHASAQGLVAVAAGMMLLDEGLVNVQEILDVVESLHVLMETCTAAQSKLIVKAAYRGEK